MEFYQLCEELGKLDNSVHGSIRALMMTITIKKDEYPELYRELLRQFDDRYEIPYAIPDDALRRYWKIATKDLLGSKGEEWSVEDWCSMEVIVESDCIEMSQWIEVSPDDDRYEE